ncbi:hypothetical protein PENTCL1PPCAC_26714, partial [Pristionchus entomophagus]
ISQGMAAVGQLNFTPSTSKGLPKKPIFETGSGEDDEDSDHMVERKKKTKKPDTKHRPPLPAVPDRSGPPMIPLGVLLDFAVQQIYHEVTVLTELLPKKQDGDKKVTLVQFAYNTRLLFAKLLAIVKWLKLSKKFDSCWSMCYFIEQQSQTFVETADRLVQLAREELIFARLPVFQVTPAIDVLASGTFPRLPSCIKNRFIRESKITPREQAYTLARINQVLNFRIACIASKLSPRIEKIEVMNGMATFTVPGEFEAKVTILGEMEKLKWTLLNIKILVDDYEIGYGKPLVHPNQVFMIHEGLQQRMNESPEPMSEMYSVLHSLAQMLQLDVLCCQATQLQTGKLMEKIVIEKYDQKERVLTIGYWLQHERGKRAAGRLNKFSPTYRLQIYGDPTNHDTSLRVRHLPAGPDFFTVDTRSGRLSLTTILSCAFDARVKNRLLRIKKRLQAAEPNAVLFQTGVAAPSLKLVLLADAYVPAPNPTEDETLSITVNMFSGKVLCQLAAIQSNPSVRELETALYSGSTTTVTLQQRLLDLKIQLLIERYRKAVTVLHVRVIGEQQMKPLLDKHSTLPKRRLCLQFIREDNFILIVGFVEDKEIVIATKLFLLEKPSLSLTAINDDDDFLPPSIIPYMRKENKKYKLPDKKRVSHLASWERPLTCAIASIDDQIGFQRVAAELTKKRYRFTPVKNEPIVGGLCINIDDVSEAIPERCTDFFSSLVRCCLRLDSRSRVMWPFECCLINSPLVNDFLPNKTGNTNSCLVLEMAASTQGNSPVSETITTMVAERLMTYCHIYDLVVRFASVYDNYRDNCSVRHFTYHKLVLAYGPLRDRLLVLNYKPRSANATAKFIINFGQCTPISYYEKEVDEGRMPSNSTDEIQWNPHVMMSHLLSERINQEWDLVELVHYLITTLAPLDAIHNFYRFRFQSQKVFAWMVNNDNYFPLAFKCHLIMITEHIVRLIYGHIHLEFAMTEDKSVFVRDVSRRGPSAVGLFKFFQTHSGGTCQITEPVSVGGMGAATPASVKQADSVCGPSPAPAADAASAAVGTPLSGPLSCAARLDVSAAPSPINVASRMPRSVPQNYMHMGSPAQPGSIAAPYSVVDGGQPETEHPNTARRTSDLTLSGSFIQIDHDTLSKACTFVEIGQGLARVSLLDDYLNALVYIRRLGIALDTFRRNATSKKYIEFVHVSHNQEQVRVSVNGQLDKGQRTAIHFNFHLDPSSMKLKLTIDYGGDDYEFYITPRFPHAGESSPSRSLIQILESYFERCIAPLHNEFAVISFINLCRCTARQAVADFAMIMRTQMDPSTDSSHSISFVHTSQKSPKDGQNKEVALLTIVESTERAVMYTLCMKPLVKKAGDNNPYTVQCVYDLINNNSSVRQASFSLEGDQDLISYVKSCQPTNPSLETKCTIWTSVLRLMEKMSTSRLTNASVCGSVGQHPPSVGPASVNAPGSNASQRQ